MTREIRIDKLEDPRDRVKFIERFGVIGDFCRCIVKDEDKGAVRIYSVFIPSGKSVEDNDIKRLIEEGFRVCENSIKKLS